MSLKINLLEAFVSRNCNVAEKTSNTIFSTQALIITTLLEKAKLAREISDGKNEIPHKFLGRKI